MPVKPPAAESANCDAECEAGRRAFEAQRAGTERTQLEKKMMTDSQEPQTRAQSQWRRVTLAADALGALLSLYLLRVHVLLDAGVPGGSLCNLGEKLNCAAAATSRFSEIVGVPIAVFGAAGFGGALLAAFVARIESLAANWAAARAQFLFFSFAAAVSVALVVISATQLTAWCPWCAGVWICSFFGLFASWRWVRAGQPHTSVGVGRAFTLLAICSAALCLTGVAVLTVVELRSQSAPLPPELWARISADDAPTRGSAQTVVTLVEFSDFQCPYCAKFASVLKEAEERSEGRLRVVFRNFPLPFHEFAEIAAIGGVCAERQGKFWQYHDFIFANQAELSAELVHRAAAEIGLNLEAFMDCLGSSDAAAEVSADVSLAHQAEAPGTPTVIIDGRQFYRGFSVESLLKRVVDR